MEEVGRIYGDRADLTLCDSADDALAGADALVVMTEWQEFRSPNFPLIRQALSEPVIFDGRNIYDPDSLAESGFSYYAIGRGKPLSRPAR
jgi:UDPglucose 6-dehydrogenase